MKIQLQLGESVGLGERKTVVQINETHARVATNSGQIEIIPRDLDEVYLLSHPRMRDHECVNNLSNFLGTFSVARVAELTSPISNDEQKETVMPSQARKRASRTVPPSKKIETKQKLGAWFQKRMDFVKSLLASKTSDDDIWDKTKRKFPSSDRKSFDTLVKSLK